MRKIYLITLGLLFSGTLAVAQAPTPELIWYKFDGAGNTVPNLASNPPTGTANATFMGGITQGGSGICNGTAIGTGLSSTTDYVNTGWATSLGTGSWTISFRMTNFPSSTTLYYIFGDASANSFRCFTNGVAGANNWIIRGGGLTDVLCTGCATPTGGMTTWVYDQAAGNLKSYFNGVLNTTVTQAGPNITSAGPFKVIGYSANVGAPAGGLLDDFRVYNRALNAAEVAAVYSGVVHNGFLGNDQTICAGDTISLTTSPYNTTTTLWSNGSTGDTIMVDSSGTYSVSWTGTCEQGADTINVTTAPAPPSPGFAGPDSTICVGDTVQLNVSTTDSILWSTGDTTNSIWVSTPGTYTVSVSGYCGTATDTVMINASALVYSGFLVADTTGGCDGDTITLSSTNMYSSYMWSTGDTSMATWVTSGGTYTLSVMDGCGSGTDTVVISPFISAVSASFTSSTNLLVATFTNTSSGGGTLSYAWDFGDGNTSTAMSPTHTYAAAGTYTVTLTVSNECGSLTTTNTVTVIAIGLDASSMLSFSAMPNPASNQVTVVAEIDHAQDLRLSVMNLQGQVLVDRSFTQVAGSFREQIELSTFAAGTYLVKLEGESASKVIRLVVQ